MSFISSPSGSYRFAFLLAPVLLAASGCLQVGLADSGSSASSGSNSSDAEADDSNGIVAGSCDAWKVAYCKAVSKCSSFEARGDCENDVGYVICLPDADTAGCEERILSALDSDSCEELPTDCGPDELADRTEPAAACDRIYAAICEWTLYCSASESTDACRAKLEAETPCTDYTAVYYPNLDACVDAYETLNCGDSPPSECEDVLRGGN